MCTCSGAWHTCGRITRTGKRARTNARKGQLLTEARKAQMTAVGERRAVIPEPIAPAFLQAIEAVREDPSLAAAFNDSIASVFARDGGGSRVE